MRLLLTISLFLLTLSAFSQTGNFDYLTANRRFTLAGRTVKGISNDTALLTASADSLVTQYAIRGYIDQRLLNTPDSSYIFDPEQFIVNGWNVSIRFPQDPGEPLFTGSPAYNLTQAHIDFLDSLMLALRDSNYTYFDDRDFYNDGTAALPFRIVRYDNHYIDSLFSLASQNALDTLLIRDPNLVYATPDGSLGTPIFRRLTDDDLPIKSITINGDTQLIRNNPVFTVNGSGASGPYHLPYNNDTTYVLAGDSTLHKLPTYTPFDSTSLSSRINQKQNKINLTTLGQTGASTLINDTLNIPNYFFATNDSTDYSFSSMTAIYSEAGPGEATIGSSGVTANKDNLNFPFKQLKALDVGGWNAGDYVSFSWPTAKNSTSYTFLRGFVRLKQAVPIIQSLSFQFFNSGVAVSQILSMVNYGLDKSKVDVYQNITIPMSAFGFNTNGFDEIRLIFGGGSSASGLYLDLFQFQNATVQENKYLTDAFRSPGTLNVYGILGGQNKLLFTDSTGTPVDTQYLRRDININTTAIAGKENAITASNTAGKYWNGYKQFVSLNTDSVTEATNKYYTDTRARAAITLTTTGTTGAATYASGVLNIPNYAAGSSQWTTATNGIYYNSGNVAIGAATITTSDKLQVTGTANIIGFNTSNSALKVGSLEFQPYALNNAWIGENTYYNGSNFVRRSVGSAGLFYFAGNEGQFRFAASGAAGSATPLTAQLKINADGSFAVGAGISNVIGNYTGAKLIVKSDGHVGINNVGAGSMLTVGGSIALAYRGISSAYTATDFDYVIVCFGSSYTVTLPSITTSVEGRTYIIKNLGTGTITIAAGSSSDLFDNSLTSLSVATGQVVNVFSGTSGAGWIKIN